jgi:shikimate kinase
VSVDKVYLVGFMGAGKTSVARALARRLDWRDVDVDTLIEAREHRPVAEIFGTKGEPYFRTVERAVLLDLLQARYLVVATGGGTFVDPANREAINRDGLSVWLDVPLKTLVDRVPADGRRPLAQDRAAFERLYHARAEAYRHANVRVQGGRRSVHEIVDEIVARMKDFEST